MAVKRLTWWLRLMATVGVVYMTVIYPPISQAFVHQSHGHHAHCQCGCGGDVTKCTCHVSSGITGFSYCEVSLNVILPLALPTINPVESTPVTLTPYQGEIPRACAEPFSPQEYFPAIDHPPKSLPV